MTEFVRSLFVIVLLVEAFGVRTVLADDFTSQRISSMISQEAIRIGVQTSPCSGSRAAAQVIVTNPRLDQGIGNGRPLCLQLAMEHRAAESCMQAVEAAMGALGYLPSTQWFVRSAAESGDSSLEMHERTWVRHGAIDGEHATIAVIRPADPSATSLVLVATR